MKAPRYDTEGLASVLPSVARTLAPAAFEGEGRKLPQAKAGIVVLADGLGNPDLDADGAARMREVLYSTGAVERVEQRIADLHAEALGIVDAAPMDPASRHALTALIERCVWRRA